MSATATPPTVPVGAEPVAATRVMHHMARRALSVSSTAELSGLVAETGSPLSHLAILARESGVATVVGHRGALQELPDGTTVLVDGASGRVTKEADA